LILSVKKSKKSTRVRLGGELSVYQTRELKDALLENLRGSPALEIDLSRVEGMDTAGFQLLLALKKESSALKKRFAITAQSPATASVLRLFNVEEYFEGGEGGGLGE
jgi:anti-anti-sigma factor